MNADPPRTGSARRRGAAVVIGLALALAAPGTYLYARSSFTHGEETCAQCGMQRTVDRRGPFQFESEPTRPPTRPPEECPDHAWKRTGCWQVGDGFEHYGA